MKRRKLLLLIALHVSRYGYAPTWEQLRRALGVNRYTLAALMQTLQREGYVAYVPNEPGSARVTDAGHAFATRGQS